MENYWVWSDSNLILQRKTLDNLNAISGGSGGGTAMRLVAVPATSASPGTIGDFAEDGSYLYTYTASGWTRAPISDWS